MSEYTQGVCHDGAAILKDGMPMTVEQILEALRERNALAAHVERQSELLRRLVSAMRNYEMDAAPDYPPPRDHRAMMSDTEATLESAPETSLARRDALKQAEALEELAETLALNSSNAYENEFHDEGDAMQAAADTALDKAAKLRGVSAPAPGDS